MIAPPLELQGDEEMLFAEHNAFVLRYVNANVNADWDTVQDAMQFAWAQWLVYQPDRRRARNWLIQVATRECWRQTAIQWRTGDDLADNAPGLTVGDTVDERGAIERLRVDERELLLAQACGLTYEDLAQRYGLTVRAIERRLKRARDHAREMRDDKHRPSQKTRFQRPLEAAGRA